MNLEDMNMKHRWVLSLVTGSFLSVTETFLLLFQGPSLEATCCYLQRTADSYRKYQPFFNCKGVSSNTLQYLFFAVYLTALSRNLPWATKKPPNHIQNEPFCHLPTYHMPLFWVVHLLLCVSFPGSLCGTDFGR